MRPDHVLPLGVLDAEDRREAPARRPLFPRSSGTESPADYYLSCGATMREWISTLLSHLSDGEATEHDMLVLAEHHAIEECQRPLRQEEKALMFRRVRDVRNCWLTMRKLRRNAQRTTEAL
jgi:hypothetical protein